MAHNEIAWRGPNDAPPPGFDHVDQSVIGVYANLDSGDWKLHAAAYFVKAGFDTVEPRADDDAFFTGYVQLERALPHGFEAFGRYEDSADTSSAAYLRLFPNFAEQRISVGARWQFARKHALTLQAASTHTMSDRYREFRLQWSAALL